MADIKDQPRPRKILGMNSKLAHAQSDPCCSENLVQKSVGAQSMERMRFPTMNNQEIPSIWPYGAFLPPVMPAPSIALPYALTPNMQYAAIPFFNQQFAAGSAGPSNGNAHAQQNMNLRELASVNINVINGMGNGIGKINTHMDSPKEEANNDDSTFRTSPVQTRFKNKDPSVQKTNSPTLGGGGGGGDPSDIVINSNTFEILKALALSGSETAEKLAYTHRNRPCFKKIDSLCARLKQDLVRPDGVLPNINSQGIAWAVKDFIFVFTRVMNAWIIIKGYVYNTPEGLNKVRSAFSPEFVRSFAAWQETTVNFVDNLIQSFINLDNLVQSQKNVYQKTTNSTPMKGGSNDDSFDQSSSSMDDYVVLPKDSTTMNNNNYMYTMVEDSDLTQRENTINGTYFKTGTYNFIKRESPDDGTSTGIEQLFDDNFAKTLSNISSVYDLLPGFKAQNENNLNCDIRVLENKLSKFSNDYDPNVEKPLGKDLVNKLNILIKRLMEMKTGSLFFKIQFCQNYFPDFIDKTPDFEDIRGIIIKCQTGIYGHIFEVVHDLRLIVYQAKKYLQKNLDLDLAAAIRSFQEEVEFIFAKEPFENYNFDHIKGIPNEILYNSGK